MRTTIWKPDQLAPSATARGAASRHVEDIVAPIPTRTTPGAGGASSKSGLAGAHEGLLTERGSGLVHGRSEDALGHEIGFSGKARLIYITLQDLRLAVVRRSARDQFGQM